MIFDFHNPKNKLSILIYYLQDLGRPIMRPNHSRTRSLIQMTTEVYFRDQGSIFQDGWLNRCVGLIEKGMEGCGR